ncbi:type 4 pilus major pilin (plasmid) [Xenorhabdus stockiae]|uniref:type 4 pilus major pilin n=1 Tax=Xenorhabdus stockiae TaxID=351614 RepID=UPI003CFB351D
MKLSISSPRRPINRGAITLIEAAIYIVLALVILVGAITQGGGLFNRNDINTEYNNVAELLTNTRSYTKTRGIYDFTSADTMTGALIQFGGAPANMTIVGEKPSGKAKLQNLWGGAVIVTPVISTGGQKSSFSLTYTSVPQEACIALATKISVAPSIVTTEVTGKITNGPVPASVAGTQCTPDDGAKGINTLKFTSNT